MTVEQMVVTAVLYAIGYLVWRGLVQPSGYGLHEIPESREARIAKLECETRMCEHVVDGEHPASISTQQGKRYWRLSDGRMWEEGTPCPFR